MSNWNQGQPPGYGPPPQQQQYPMQQQQQPHGAPQPPVAIYVTQQASTYVMKAPFSHGLHIVLDIISCGLWLPIHLLLWACH